MELAPVALFCYARPDHLAKTLTALRANTLAEQSKLYVFADAAKSARAEEGVQQVRKIIHQIEGFRDIVLVTREKNHGLAASIIKGATRLCEDYGRVIVLEDDLVTSPYFLQFMNDALERYADEQKVMSVAGYSHPPEIMPIPPGYAHDVYFAYRNSSWGWATWRDRWQGVDWNVDDFAEFLGDKHARRRFARGGEDLLDMLKDQRRGMISSWAIRFSYAHSRQGRYALYPVASYVDNIGMDATGTHYVRASDRLRNDLSLAKERCEFPDGIMLNHELLRRFRDVTKYKLRSRIKRLVLEPFRPNPWDRA